MRHTGGVTGGVEIEQRHPEFPEATRDERATLPRGHATRREVTVVSALTALTVVGSFAAGTAVAARKGGSDRRTVRRPRPGDRRRNPGTRGSFRRWIKKTFRVKKGVQRRHIVSDRFVRSFVAQLTAEQLKKLGYDPRKYGGIEKARRAYQLDIFNNPRNLWVGDAEENEEKGRNWRHGPNNWDFPPSWKPGWSPPQLFGK